MDSHCSPNNPDQTKLQTEIDHLKEKSEERQSRAEEGARSSDMSVDVIGDGLVI